MREKIIQFLDISGIAKFPDIVGAGLVEQTRAPFGDAPVSEFPPQFKKVIDLVTKAADECKPKLFERIVTTYGEAFDETDIDALIAFYSSPTGKKVVEFNGIVLPSLMVISDEWSIETMKSIENELSAILTEVPPTEQISEPQPQPQP